MVWRIKRKKIHTAQNVVATQKRKYKVPVGIYIFLFLVVTYGVIKFTSVYDSGKSIPDQMDVISAYFKKTVCIIF